MARVDYSPVAPKYDQRYAQHAFPGIEAALEAFVAEGLRVLEVGCGTGHWLARLEALGCQVSGIDAEPAMLAKARERGLHAELMHGSATDLPWPDRSFDRVVCINAVHHFPDKARFVREAARVLRPRGRLLCIGMDPSVADEAWFVYDYFERTRALDKARYPSATLLRELMQAAGFATAHTTVAEHLLFEREARTALTSGLLAKHVTSQLILLSDAEYAQGVARIEQDASAADARGDVLHLRGDLRLYATVGERASDAEL